ncbi:hypothetical protein ABNQ39_00100 (plasmid) [Azospirillum sp. A26]|uniref:hypothetical protein n=1 Tax=Azospirillum sp. A26 TaxID=3160607 RepID=UPI003672BBB1
MPLIPTTLAELQHVVAADRTIDKPVAYASRTHVIFNHAGKDEPAAVGAAWDEVSRLQPGGSLWWETPLSLERNPITDAIVLRGALTLTYKD